MKMNPLAWVAIILSVGISLALNVMTVAALWVALQPLDPELIPSLGENSTKVLLAWGGGITSTVAGIVGYLIHPPPPEE